MGAYGSNCLNDPGDIVSELCDPSSPNWISAHSESTKLCQSYVKQLWERFKNVGGDGRTGLLKKNVILNSEESELKTLLADFPTNKDGNITFQTFCIALKWNEGAKIEDKVKECFKKMNSNQPIDKDTLVKLLGKIYSDESEESLTRLASVFMLQMNENTSETIEEKHFVLWMKTMPFETVNAVLDHFDIRLEEGNCPDGCLSLDKNIPSYQILENIADKIHDQDWQPLAKRLGFVEEDIQGFQRMNPTILRDQVQSMLNAWRDTNSSAATFDALIAAMMECNLNDVISTVRV